MNCLEYEDKLENLKKVLADMSNDEFDFALEKINELACLVCKNKDEQTVSALLICLEKRVDVDGYNHAVWYALARVNQSVSNHERAEQAYLKAINLAPLNTEYLERIARFYMSAFKWEKSRDYCRRLVALLPEKQRDVNGIMVSVFYGCRMYKDAIQNVELGICFDDLQVVYKAMYSYIELNKEAEVITLADKIVLSENDDSYGILELIAQAYFTLAMYDKALEIFLKLADRDYKKYRNDVAATYSNMGDFDRSLAMLDQILVENPNDINALSNYALTILKIDTEKNFEKAVECYKNIIKIDPRNINAYNKLGLLYYEDKQHAVAHEYYRELLNLMPNAEWVVRRLLTCVLGELAGGGEIELNSGRGIALCSILKESFSMTANDYLSANICYRNLNQLKEGVENILMALNIEPTNANILFSAAMTFKAKGDVERACEYIESALRAEKDNVNYLVVYSELLLRVGDRVKAEKIYKRIVEIDETSESLNALGWFYCEEKDYEKALEILLSALRVEMKRSEPYSAFAHKIKNNLVYVYIMDNKADELMALMNSAEFAALYSDETGNAMKAIIYLKAGDIENANKCIPELLIKAYPSGFNLLFEAFAAFNFKRDNWHETCVRCLKDIEVDAPEYICFKEDICRCLGYAYRKMHDSKSALLYFEKASKIGTRNAVNWYEVGVERLYSDEEEAQDKIVDAFEKAYRCENAKAIRPLSYLMEKFSACDDLTKSEKADLISEFFRLSDRILELKQQLIYTDSDPVYHFTRLSVLKELLKPQATLRINNAAHMNDPEEGKVMFRNVFKNYMTDVELEMLSPPNMFLSSFCLMGDILPLWNEYGDKSKGCSLELSADFFDKEDNDFYENLFLANNGNASLGEQFTYPVVDFVENQVRDINDFTAEILSGEKNGDVKRAEGLIRQNQQIIESAPLKEGVDLITKLFDLSKPQKNKECYCLYFVVYVDETGEMVNLLDKKEEIEQMLNEIRILLKEFDEKDQRAQVKKILKQISHELLSEVRYLFKSATYSYEQEVRIAKPYLIDDSNVKEWAPDGDSIPNLYLEMERKLHFTKCILGPKVEHPSKLMPYLCRNHVIDAIEVSKIKYR